MIGKTPTEHQMTIFETALESFIDMNHELVLLAQRIDWSEVEREFSKYYCKDNGRPSVPARKMVGLMYLKNLYNLSDEDVVDRWLENPYMQYFTGEKVFQKRPPIDPADFSKFRKRIGPRGAEILFRISLCVNAEELTEKETSGSPGQTYYEKTKERKKFRKRAGIEPVIGHLKSDHRMIRNYLSGTTGDAINTLMAAAAYNLRHWMNKLPKKKLSSFVSLLLNLRNRLENLIIGCGKTYGLPYPVLATVEN